MVEGGSGQYEEYHDKTHHLVEEEASKYVTEGDYSGYSYWLGGAITLGLGVISYCFCCSNQAPDLGVPNVWAENAF